MVYPYCFVNFFHRLDALSHPLTELPMLKLDEFLCFLVHILFFGNLFCTHFLALSPPHIRIIEDLTRFFSCIGNSGLLHRVPVMMMMMRFVIGGVFKYHSFFSFRVWFCEIYL